MTPRLSTASIVSLTLLACQPQPQPIPLPIPLRLEALDRGLALLEEGVVFEKVVLPRDANFLAAAPLGDVARQHPRTWLASTSRRLGIPICPPPEEKCFAGHQARLWVLSTPQRTEADTVSLVVGFAYYIPDDRRQAPPEAHARSSVVPVTADRTVSWTITLLPDSLGRLQLTRITPSVAADAF